MNFIIRFLKTVRRDLTMLFNLNQEFRRGFKAYGNLGPMVSVFGSARIAFSHPAIQKAEEVAYRLGLAGYTIMTGGGPSIMEAANRGAKRAQSRSVACNIILSHEKGANPFVDESITMKYFFSRKYMLISYSHGFVVFPGGVGTLDELFEIITLMQTSKIKRRPIFLVGAEYWKGLESWMKGPLMESLAIDQETLNLFTVTDDLDLICNTLIADLKNTTKKA
jgi:uncharacterized protein (TIGR00730 family)